MSICRARLLNTSNALTLRMSSEQIRLQVSLKLFGVNTQQLDPADDQAVNSKLLARRQKMYGYERCYGELSELTVDDIWQIAGAGDQQLQRLAHVQ